MQRRMRSAGFVCALLLLVGLAACAPHEKTETADPLGALAKQRAMLALAAQGKPGCTGIPASVSADMPCADARWAVTGEAEVSVLGDGAFPIVRVKPAAFTNRQARRLLRQFLPQATLYEVTDVRDKAHVAEAIRALEAQKPLYEAYGIEGYPYMLRILQDELAIAPSIVANVRAKKALHPIVKDHGAGAVQTHKGLFVGESPVYGDPVRYLSIDNSPDALQAEYREVYGRTALLYTGYVGATAIYDDLRTERDYGTAAVVGAVSGAAAPDVCAGMLSLSPDEAARQAERVAQSMGFDARAVSVVLVKASRRSMLPEGADVPADGYYYEVRCTRRVRGAGSVYLAGGAAASGGMSGVHFGTWAFESAVFQLDDLGMFRMEWTSPQTVTETLVAQAALLPFAQIMAQFRKQEAALFKVCLQDEAVSARLTLTRVQLGLVRTPAYDELDSGLLVPAWAFYGTLEGESPDGVTVRYNDGTARPVLLVHAVTGEAIDPSAVS